MLNLQGGNMRKHIIVTMGCIFIGLMLVACSNNTDEINLTETAIAEETISREIKSIKISTLPESEDKERRYTTEDKIEKIREHIDSLSWKDVTSENPEDYTGITYIVTIEFDDETTKTYSFFANQFFKFDGIEWMKIKESDVMKLENIIKDTPTD